MREPPLRLLGLAAVRAFSRDPEVRARWSADAYTQYLIGLLEAADLARRSGLRAITAIEFGVASGRGLLAMQRHAQSVEAATGVGIRVVGFDAGSGLPELLQDHRDHPDYWQAGDFPMDEQWLRGRLDLRRSRLVIGDARETVTAFLEGSYAPIGFVAFDLDLYSGTAAALRVLSGGRRNILRRVPLYFDDVCATVNHGWAGERLAIAEFNAESPDVKIDRWHGIRHGKVFPEHGYWEGMYMAHDLAAIGRYALRRERRRL